MQPGGSVLYIIPPPPQELQQMEQIKQEFYEAKALSFKMRRMSSEPSASSPSSARCVRAVFYNHSLPDYIYSLIFVLTFIASWIRIVLHFSERHQSLSSSVAKQSDVLKTGCLGPTLEKEERKEKQYRKEESK